jgi:NADPH:quinone reductase-like Zn-dependent oxidoreductase
MRAIVNTKAGGPEVLQVQELPSPEVKDGQIKIEVKAAGLNFADILARMGMYQAAPPPPMTVGYEVSGLVSAVGAGVTEFSVGQRVLALCRFGGQSSEVVVPAIQAMPIPEAMSFESAAAIPVNYLTAWHCLVYLGNLQRGQTVLIHAAAGGVGQAGLQICKLFGAKTIGTASASKHEALKNAGLDEAIDYNTQDFEVEVKRLTDGKGVHHILDAVGGKSFAKSYRVLRSTGRLYCFGVSDMAGESKSTLRMIASVARMPFFHPVKLMMQNKGVFGIDLGSLWDEAEMLRGQLEEMTKHFVSGALKPVVDKVFPFAEAGAAHQYIQARKNFGKVILVP